MFTRFWLGFPKQLPLFEWGDGLRYCRVAQGGLEVTYELEAGLGLLLPPECSGDRQMPPYLAQLPVQVRLKPTLGWNASFSTYMLVPNTNTPCLPGIALL